MSPKKKYDRTRTARDFAEALRPYIDRLNTCKGVIHCPEAAGWADKLGDELVACARDADDRSYAHFSFRAVLMGFFLAMSWHNG